ncbi:hypothetical protein CHLNCDRAFT_30542 [Chlorella variabilis]|uniref:protein-tyrosine-phosphatase n=1 Tax=Chlorella variabilis TaxID=554065 RepID=E1ZB60_CHLVA|nr:hypothetical protein CHLNCDRAFT_30542 [Chlorella variabilis]EFN57172.1 hypothetical protein CHLNCDRAFT_30542 [Chlorella variabilis]|eukprot:XP_005849274.1 hypothetical protein CHLNCDRAFT_30542 [Chlorella variabilis]
MVYPGPPRSLFKAQAAVLAEIKGGDWRTSLRRVDTVRTTDMAGGVREESWPGLQPPEHSPEEQAALAALAALRLRAKNDCLPCRVAPGLYIGGAGAARNLKALRKRGITHIVNAAPSVPCHFKDNPEGCFAYLSLPLFDDADADLLAHVDASNAFISAARRCGGSVLVHCYAGQSRSAALVIAHLIASQGLGLMDAWAATRRARPCAQPNSGFLRQLALYAKRTSRGPAEAGCSPGTSPSGSESELVLTQ